MQNVNCVDFKDGTIFGFVVLAGTDAGGASMLDIHSLAEFKVVQTNGAPARSRFGTLTVDPAPSEPGYEPAAVQTTAVKFASSNGFFAGHSDGVVRLFEATTGSTLRTFTPPAASAGPVVAIAVYGNKPLMLAVGHAPSGDVHHYNMATGAYRGVNWWDTIEHSPPALAPSSTVQLASF